MDQIISYFGKPDKVKYELRHLCGEDKNEWIIMILICIMVILKISLKSSYFMKHKRPSFCVYGKKGSFIKETPDRQEEHLKEFYMPGHKDFGVDLPQHYGKLYTVDENGKDIIEVVTSEVR